MKEVKSHHKRVARYLSTGRWSLKEICETLGLNYSSWSQIVQSPIFRATVEEYQVQLDEEFIEEEKEDPIRMRLRMLQGKAVDTISGAMSSVNPQTGFTDATALRASQDVLDRLGYYSEKETITPKITITLTEDQAKAISISVDALPAQPKKVVET